MLSDLHSVKLPLEELIKQKNSQRGDSALRWIFALNAN